MSEKNKVTRRQFLRVAALGAGGITLAACGSPQVVEKIVEKPVEVIKEVVKEVEKPVEVVKEVEKKVEVVVTATPAPEGPKTLTVWGSGLDLSTIEKDPTNKGAAMVAHKNAFLAKNPGTTIVWEDHGWDEALRQNVVTALLAGTQPDVIVGENFFQQYASLGALLPIDAALKQDAAILENSITGTHKAAIYDGKHYGLSWLSGCFGFEANPNVLKDAGLPEEIPATWDDMLIAAQTVSEKSKGEIGGYSLQGPLGFSVGGMFRLAVYMQQLGTTLNKADNPFMPNFDDEKGFPAWEFVRKILPFTPKGLVFESDEGKVYSQLFAGKSAMQMAGSWHVGWAKDSGLKNAIYGQVPVAPGGKPASYVVGNVIYGAMAASKSPQLAIDWITTSQDATIQDIIFKSAGRLPSTKKSIELLLKDASVDDATKKFATLLRDSDLGILPQWNKEPNKLNTIWNDLFTAVLTTDTPIPALAGEAQKKAMEVVSAA
jgi:ABC-type glycerol-3-phosphate transport system substrate-binding protein